MNRASILNRLLSDLADLEPGSLIKLLEDRDLSAIADEEAEVLFSEVKNRMGDDCLPDLLDSVLQVVSDAGVWIEYAASDYRVNWDGHATNPAI